MPSPTSNKKFHRQCPQFKLLIFDSASVRLVLDVQDGHDQVDEPENKCNDRQYSRCGVIKLLHNYLPVN